MALDTYSELQTEVGEWLQRGDLSARIPTFIEKATARFSAELRVFEMEALASASADAEYTDLPDDFLEVRAIESGGDRLEYLTPERFQQYVEDEATPDKPVYTLADLSLRIYPFPTVSATLPLVILYYQRVPALVNSSDTNWMLTNYPHIYLDASLVEGFRFVQDFASAAQYEAVVSARLGEMQRRAARMAMGASTMAVKAR